MTLQSKVTANNIVIKCADKFVGDKWTMNSTLYNMEALIKESLLEK